MARQTRPAPALLAVVAVVALAVAACGPDDDPVLPTPTGSPATATPTPDPQTPGPEPTEAEPGAGVDPVTDERGLDASEDAGGGGLLTVTDVRIGTHGGFDRIVFEIVGEGDAGWLVHYVDDPRTQGQGAPVGIEGEAVLEVILRGIALPPDVPDREQWEGDRLDGPAGASTIELVEDSIFEGQQVFHIGLPSELPFGVTRLEDPQRIVVEVEHG